MLRNRYILRSVTDMVTKAAKQTIEDLRDGWVEQEPPFTDRLVANLQNQLDGKTVKGIRWKAKTLTDRGRHSQESTFGADFLGVLTLDLLGLRVMKGFFAQAKLIRRGNSRTQASEFERLRDQCHKMLSVTPDSFVFLYSKRGIKIIPASSVVGTSAEHLNSLWNRTIGRFFTEYVECFVGDPKLNAPSLEKFYAVAERYEIRQGLYVHASDEGDLPEPQPEPIKQHQAIRQDTSGRVSQSDTLHEEEDQDYRIRQVHQPERVRRLLH